MKHVHTILSLKMEIFRQIDSNALALIETLLSRNFCEESVRVNFCAVAHCGVK